MTQKSCAVGMRNAILRNHFKDSFGFRNRKDESGTLLNNKRLERESAIHALANSRRSYPENAEERFEGGLKLFKI